MNMFDIDVEATVHVLAYDYSEVLAYREIERIPCDTNKKVHFSLLIHVKQTEFAHHGAIQVFVVHVMDNVRDRQKIEKFLVGEISLCTDTLESVDYGVLHIDPWNVRRTFRWNVSNVPTKGCGLYAVILAVGLENTLKHKDILDCAYFKVI